MRHERIILGDADGVEFRRLRLDEIVDPGFLEPVGQAHRVWNDMCEMLERREPQHVMPLFTNQRGSPRGYRVLRLPLSTDGSAVDQVVIRVKCTRRSIIDPATDSDGRSAGEAAPYSSSSNICTIASHSAASDPAATGLAARRYQYPALARSPSLR